MTDLIDKFYKLSGTDATKDDREKLLRQMSNEEIQYLIDHAGIIQAKIFYSNFLKKE